jgi:hypothetical protein
MNLLERNHNMRLRPFNPPIRNLIRRMPTAFIETTSEHPDQYWDLLSAHRRRTRRPNVQVQTVLGLRICILEFRYKGPEDPRGGVAVLHADGLVRRCRMWTASLIGSCDSRLEAEIGGGRSAKGNAVPLVDLGEGGIYEAVIDTACGVYSEERGGCVVRTSWTLRECASQ